MKTKNTVFLLIVALAVFGAIIYKSQQQEEITTEAAIPVKALPSVTSGTVERIVVQAPGEKVVTLQRSGEKWYTNVKQKYEADESAIRGALSALDQPIEAEVVSTNPDNFAEYEVDNTRGTHVQVYEKGKSEAALDIYVGKDGPNAFSTYVRKNGEDQVLNARASLSMAFKKPDGWRNKAIFEFAGTNATRVDENGTSATFSVAKQGENKWMMEAPDKAEADYAKLSSLTNMVGNLRANSFVDLESSQTLADLGLEPARQTVKVTYLDKTTSPAKEMTATLLIGKESDTKGDWYAKRADKNDLFTIGQYMADSISPDPASLMAPKPEPTPAPAEASETSATAVTDTGTSVADEATTASKEPAPEPAAAATTGTTDIELPRGPVPADEPVTTAPAAAAAETSATDAVTSAP